MDSPAAGKMCVGIRGTLVGSIMVCAAVMMITACDKPKKPVEQSPGKTPQAPVTSITDDPVEETKIPDKAALDDMLAHMSPSESQEFVRILEQNPEYTGDGSEDTGKSDVLPKFFPLTEALRELIRQAEHALRMDLSDEEKLKALEDLDGINHPDILDVINSALDDPDLADVYLTRIDGEFPVDVYCPRLQEMFDGAKTPTVLHDETMTNAKDKRSYRVTQFLIS